MPWVDDLPDLIRAGWSYERIAAVSSVDAETVAGQARRLGLRSAHADRAAPKGPLDAEVLRLLLAQGLSVRAIAARTARSPATVRHWMRRHDLIPVGRSPCATTVGGPDGHLLLGHCPKHGDVPFAVRSDGGARCLACRSAAVSKRRRKVKSILVAEAGGRCSLCGYARCEAALQFHHRDRTTKRFALSRGGAPLALARLRVEARKCVLLCANCHAEVEQGRVTLPATPSHSNPE